MCNGKKVYQLLERAKKGSQTVEQNFSPCIQRQGNANPKHTQSDTEAVTPLDFERIFNESLLHSTKKRFETESAKFLLQRRNMLRKAKS